MFSEIGRNIKWNKNSLHTKFTPRINCHLAWKEIILSISRWKAEKKKIKPLLRNQKRLFEGCRKNGCFQGTWVEQITWGCTADLLCFRPIKGLLAHTSRHVTQVIIITSVAERPQPAYELEMKFEAVLLTKHHLFSFVVFVWRLNCCALV